MAQQSSTYTFAEKVNDPAYRLPCDCSAEVRAYGLDCGDTWHFDHERLTAEQSVIESGPICPLGGDCPEYLAAIPTRGILNTCERGMHVQMSRRLRAAWPEIQAKLLEEV